MSDFFNTSIGDIKEPAVFPDGKYLATAANYETGSAGTNDTEYLDITFRVIEPVDGQDVSEFNLATFSLTKRWWLTEYSIYYLVENLKSINPEAAKAKDIAEAVEMYAIGSDTIITVGPDKKFAKRKMIKGFDSVS